MPYPSQIDKEKIVGVATDLVVEHGQAWLTLSKLAQALGVKAPSLYRYFRSKNDLIQEINRRTYNAMFDAIDEAMQQAGEDARAQLTAVATSHRIFGVANPNLYTMLILCLFPGNCPSIEDGKTVREQIYQAMQRFTSIEPQVATIGMRTVVHGFILDEVGGMFQAETDMEAIFNTIIKVYLDGLRQQ